MVGGGAAAAAAAVLVVVVVYAWWGRGKRGLGNAGNAGKEQCLSWGRWGSRREEEAGVTCPLRLVPFIDIIVEYAL